MNSNEQLNLIDLLSILSFLIALENLDMNITQSDLDDKTKLLLDEIHGHLEKQDEMLQRIERKLNNDS